MKAEVCERCGERKSLQTVSTTRGEKQRVRLCADCIRVVIRKNTNYQVEK